MQLKNLIFVVIIGLLIFPRIFRAEGSPTEAFPGIVGEELFYKVKYSFLTVGSLHFEVIEQIMYEGQRVYHCKMHMKSGSAIPFVNFDDTYDSYIDADSVYTHLFWATEKQGDYVLSTLYDADYSANILKISVKRNFKTDTLIVLDSTVTIPGKIQDGLSLLYYARANAKHKESNQMVNIFTLNKLRSAIINFTGETDDVNTRGKKLDGFYLDGRMKFVGIAGVKEGFKGWFSPDAQSVPLHARMKAFIGSIKLNLEWWKNWTGETLLGEKVIKKNREKLQKMAEKESRNN